MCPVCRARFRSTIECSRCGADLGTLMRLQARAWRLRHAARRAIVEGDLERALHFATVAEAICHTPAGKGLKGLSAWFCSLGGSNGRVEEVRVETNAAADDPEE